MLPTLLRLAACLLVLAAALPAAEPPAKPERGKPLRLEWLAMDLAFVPSGNFVMGSPASEDSRDGDERQHAVVFAGDFWLGATEVTQKQYAAIAGANPSRFPCEVNPVERVTWQEAADFCRELSRREAGRGRLPAGYSYRLPTEAEWEYACRAGNATVFSSGNSLDSLGANFDGTYPYGEGRPAVFRQKPVSAGSFAPNAWGLRDMHGNVWEWCLDWYWDYPLQPATDPRGPEAGTYRVVRGGGWLDGGRNCRSAERLGQLPAERLANVGFRVALGAAP